MFLILCWILFLILFYILSSKNVFDLVLDIVSEFDLDSFRYKLQQSKELMNHHDLTTLCVICVRSLPFESCG